ncbi:LamG-like jellyroll fold domain-containing protein [Curtobacterium sp. MCBD17_032]|uniref:LamG-like jellyroll fold domain-containing protein n=1 Tax=Curtobacterium sp. MCBD17_032 TaxID=2175659 RepID=UPI000DA87B36|nr:LamG-like jellyroll fold domain-containing protein [Curtobacterium sp. MCBD17_032]PZE81079.1 hypothetical protein DEI91_13220 [Curtobacterium sp. MCBD17_032]
MTAPRCPGDRLPVLVAVLARTALWTALLLVLWPVVASVLGAEVTTVMSDSMAPAIRSGDVVATVPTSAEHITPGRVLLVDDPDRPDRLRLHRLHRVEADGLRLRGDANPDADTSLVAPAAVHGIGVLRFPFSGLPVVWSRSGDWLTIVTVALAVVALVRVAGLDRAVRSGIPCARCGTPRSMTVPLGGHDRRGGARVLLPTATVLIGLALAGSTLAGAVFSGVTSGTGSFGTAAFDCFRQHPDDDAVLAWDFDEPRGDVVDRSGHGNTGTMSDGAGRVDASCADGPRLVLAGESSRLVSTTSGTPPTTFSVEVWFRTDTARGHVLGFGSDRTSVSSIKSRLVYLDGKGLVHVGVQGAGNGFRFQVASKEAVHDDTWHHVVGTFTPGRLELWLDGIAQSSRSDLRNPETTPGYWRVGRQSLDPWAGATYPYDFAGEVDHVRVYERVLSADEIRAHAAAGR